MFEMGKRFLAQDDLKQGQQLPLDQHSFGLGIFKLVANLALFICRIHRTADSPNSSSRVKRDGVLWTIEREKADVIPLLYPQPVQPVGNAIDHRNDFAISQHEVMKYNRRTFWIALSRSPQELVIRYIREIYRRPKKLTRNHLMRH